MGYLVMAAMLGPFERLLTAADLAVLPADLPSGPVDYELDNGRLVVMSPAGHRRGETQHAVGQLIGKYGKEAGHGRVFTETGVVLWKGPDRVVVPDVAFVANAQLPLKSSREGYLETIPDLVVEVRSKNDSLHELEVKSRDYLRAGVRVVWIVDCDARTIAVHHDTGETQVLGENDMLRAEGVIPGMDVRVGGLFAS